MDELEKYFELNVDRMAHKTIKGATLKFKLDKEVVGKRYLIWRYKYVRNLK